MLPTKEATWS